jgi:hypothetical protein
MKPTSGRASARRSITSVTWDASTAGRLRNLSRAGVLKKRSQISMSVPSGAPASATLSITPPENRISVAVASPRRFVRRRTLDTLPMLGSASPRKP